MQSDEACQVAPEIWLDLLNSNEVDNVDSMLSFRECLSLLSTAAKGFSCRLSHNLNGKCTGAVSLAGSIRDNFERFGCYLCLDTCKRKTTALLWPCLVVSLNNELGRVCLACEAIMLREQIDACKFILDFLFDACTRRTRDEVLILLGDGFLRKKIW